MTPTDARDDLVEQPGIHPVEKLWREVGLPEYFLGNGGTNKRLYALYDAIRDDAATRIQQLTARAESAEAQVERLREALRRIAYDDYSAGGRALTSNAPIMIWQAAARAALNAKPDQP